MQKNQLCHHRNQLNVFNYVNYKGGLVEHKVTVHVYERNLLTLHTYYL